MLFRTKRTEVKLPAPERITLEFLTTAGTVDIRPEDEFEYHGTKYRVAESKVVSLGWEHKLAIILRKA